MHHEGENEKHKRRQLIIFPKFGMFTGSTKQRKVDYSGGKKRDTERKDFLLKQARLREDRAAERLRVNSATKIQKNFRCHRCYIHMRQTFGQEFDKRISDIKKLEMVFASTNKTFSTPLEVILVMIRLLTFSKLDVDMDRCDQSKQRVISLLPIILKSIKVSRANEQNKSSYSHIIHAIDVSSNGAHHWQFLSSTFLVNILQFLEEKHRGRIDLSMHEYDLLIEGAVEFLTYLLTSSSSSSSSSSSINVDIGNTMECAKVGVLRLSIKNICSLLRSLVVVDEYFIDAIFDEKNAGERLVKVLTASISCAASILPSSFFSSQLLACNKRAYVNSWSCFTDIILTIHNLGGIAKLGPIIADMNKDNGEKWALVMQLSAIFREKKTEVNYDIVKKLSFLCNFCECYFNHENKTTNQSRSLNQCLLLVPRERTLSDSLSTIENSWVHILSTCILSLPLHSLIDSTQADTFPVVNEAELVTESVKILNTGRGGGLKRLDTMVFLARVNAKSTEASNCASLLSTTSIFESSRVLESMFSRQVLVDLLYSSLRNRSMTKDLPVSTLTSIVHMVVSIYTRVLLCCPPVNNKAYMAQLAAQKSTTRTMVLNVLAFAQPKLSLLLWEYLLMINLDQAVVAPKQVGHKERHENNMMVMEVFFLFCTVLYHQLLATDDDELLGERGIEGKMGVVIENDENILMPVETLRHIVCTLRQFLYQAYWVESTMQTTSHASLFDLQLLLAATKLFNHMCVINERRKFLRESDFLWQLAPSDVTIVGENNNHDNSNGMNDNGVEGEQEIESLDGFRFPNPNTKIVLTTVPQVVSFKKRVEIFETLISADKTMVAGNGPLNMWNFHTSQPNSMIEIKRDDILGSSIQEIGDYGPGRLKARIQVQFVSDQGVQEPGIDGGGLFKEFLEELCRIGFNNSNANGSLGLFTSTSAELLVPSPSAECTMGKNAFLYFNFMGKILGKAVYERILVETEFSPVFLNVLLGRLNQTDDLVHFDSVLYRSLMQMKRYMSTGGNIEDLGLFFEVTRTHKDGTVLSTEPLIPNGSSIPVTNENAMMYIHRLANFKLNTEISGASKSFLQGFRDLIPVNWIRMFNPKELQLLIGGEDRVIDIANMKANVGYAGGFAESQPYIQEFWRFIGDMSSEQQQKFLKFVTSCPRSPLLGFEALNPRFGILKIPTHDQGDDPSAVSEKLPSAATCMNLLKLPQYSTVGKLKEKLLYAIESNSGFELS